MERNKIPAFLVLVLSAVLLLIKIQTGINSLYMFYQYKNILHLFQWLHYTYWRVLGLKLLQGAVHSDAAQGWAFGFDKHKSHIQGRWATAAVSVSARSFQPSWTANSLHVSESNLWQLDKKAFTVLGDEWMEEYALHSLKLLWC